MTLLELFLGFLRVGCFSFGGAYGAIPLIRDIVLSYGWLDDEALTYMIAVSESTPGPIMVNLATYVGSSQAGIPGALIATFAVVLPAFVIILAVAALFDKVLKNKYFQAILRGVKPCVIGIVLATGIYMTLRAVLHTGDVGNIDLRDAGIAVLLAAIMFALPAFTKKKISPILLIVISAGLGAVIYSI